MGNCQAAEVAAVVVQHPGNGKVDRTYWTISAHEVMSSNPGYYVALVRHSSPTTTNTTHNNCINTNEQPSLKLLKPTDTLHLGHLYRLISFEDVIKEFAAKKSVKLGKLLKDSGAGLTLDKNNKSDATRSTLHHNQVEQQGIGSSISRRTTSGRVGRHHVSGGQWKPVLQSVAEIEG